MEDRRGGAERERSILTKGKHRVMISAKPQHPESFIAKGAHTLSPRGNYQKYVNRNPTQRLLIWYFHRWVNRLVEISGATRLLDVGCGEGFTIERLIRVNDHLRIQGLDHHLPALVEATETNPGIIFFLGDITCLPFASDSFEAVLCLEVLEHLADPVPALEELGRVTSKYCLISVPNEPFFMGANLLRGKNVYAWGNDPEHLQKWTADRIVRMIREHFEVEKVVYPFPWVMALCRK